ncbi:hypothetical protein [Nocardia terpenica]|uniref:Uncharacterized protein n=1 Tax=Nocardia terpenica TaxID=455432 RepID=A0A161XFM2_9NOCA|nr:hypothetical protein [Nocardia terpenica]KZM72218.1 hypothetical protein AWN90_36695 [Nocardia terpenica]
MEVVDFIGAMPGEVHDVVDFGGTADAHREAELTLKFVALQYIRPISPVLRTYLAGAPGTPSHNTTA